MVALGVFACGLGFPRVVCVWPWIPLGVYACGHEVPRCVCVWPFIPSERMRVAMIPSECMRVAMDSRGVYVCGDGCRGVSRSVAR